MTVVKNAQIVEHQVDLVNHLGLRLARAYQVFKREMQKGLHESGHADLLASHLLILPVVGYDGASTAEIVERVGLAKQAVSRALKELQALNYVEIQPDPNDGRARIVMPKQRALDMYAASAPLKAAFHVRAARAIGTNDFDDLLVALQAIEREFSV
ncbi:MAG: MarR family winged helix-turn-helix transcriptional regulator [Paracoccaceae bacterium]